MPMLFDFRNALHPLFVHFPIVLWLAALVVLALSLSASEQARWRAGCWLLHAGGIAALAAVGSGLWAAELLGHDSPGHDLVHVHRNTMLVAAGLGLLSSAVALVRRREPTKAVKVGVVGLLAITVIVTMVGADRGAELVYRYGVGVERAVPPVGAPHGHGEDGAGHGDQGEHQGSSAGHHEATVAAPSKATSAPQGPSPSASSSAPAAPAVSTMPAAPPAATQGHPHPAGHQHAH